MRDLMMCLHEIMKDYKNEVKGERVQQILGCYQLLDAGESDVVYLSYR